MNKIVLEINFKNRNLVELILKNGSKVIERADLEFNRNLEHILISGLARLNFWTGASSAKSKDKPKNLGGLDKVLNKNKMPLLSLKGVRIAGKVKKDSLSYQIAQVFKKALE